MMNKARLTMIARDRFVAAATLVDSGFSLVGMPYYCEENDAQHELTEYDEARAAVLFARAEAAETARQEGRLAVLRARPEDAHMLTGGRRSLRATFPMVIMECDPAYEETT